MFRHGDGPLSDLDLARRTLVAVGDFWALGRRLRLPIFDKIAVGVEGIGDAIVTKGVEAREDGGAAESMQADRASEGSSLLNA